MPNARRGQPILTADTTRVRSLVMSVPLYKDLILSLLVSDEWALFLNSWPDGYWYMTADDYLRILARITQPGPYPTGNFWELFDGPPYFDPSIARVPGLNRLGVTRLHPGSRFCRVAASQPYPPGVLRRIRLLHVIRIAVCSVHAR